MQDIGVQNGGLGVAPPSHFKRVSILFRVMVMISIRLINHYFEP